MSSPVRAKMKQSAIAAGFGLFRITGAHKLSARWTGGLGAILMFHRVRPNPGEAFAPNSLLEITPEFLARTIETVRGQGIDIVSLDDALERLRSGNPGQRRFAVLSFDDAYQDNLDHALPVLRQYQTPFIVYAVPGFADRTAGLWWVELEEAVRSLPHIEVEAGGQKLDLRCLNDSEKVDSFNALYWLLRALPEGEMRAVIRKLAERAGVDWQAIVREACMDWDGLAQLAAEPLCTIGAHTMTHPMLAKLSAEDAKHETQRSREILAERTGGPVNHFAYPVGDPGSAGSKEFAMVQELGFASAVTTRPGMIFAEHQAHCCALPRLSVNGNWQSTAALEVLLSGAPFVLWNRGQRVDVA